MTVDLPLLPPHDIDAEQSVLGAILLHPSALCRAQQILTGRDFYDSRHQRIWEAFEALTAQDEAIDLVTVGNHLESSGHLSRIGGRSALAELLTVVGSSVNIEHHSRIVRDCAIRRQLIRFAAEVTQSAHATGRAEDLMRDTERALFKISSGRDQRNWCPLSEVSNETVEYVDKMSKRADKVIGLPTGYTSLDALLGGWQRSDLIVMAARPSMGKTALALGSAYAAAKAGYRVGFVSLEMSRRQLGLRLHGTGATIDVHALKIGSLTSEGWWRFADTAQQLSSLPFWIDDSSLMTIDQLAAKARHLKARHGLDLLVVDYLQLLQLHHAETRQQGIADISRKLKLLAKELDIPVVALSQLSRECEKRTDPRPILSDLRDSGAIEQDADVVMFIYRDEIYNAASEDKGLAEIIVRKHRNGPIGVRRLVFIERYAQFCELDPVHL